MIWGARLFFGADVGTGSIVTQQRQLAERAPFLFSDLPQDMMEKVEKEEKAGRWTGERLAQQKPEIYAIIIKMLAADFPVISIAQLCGVSENTVRGIREREPRSIEDSKKRMTGKLVIAKERLIDRIIEEAPTMDGRDAAVAMGIVADKLALETGAPTQRIDVTGLPGADFYAEWLKTQVLDGCVEVIGLGSLPCGQTREPAAGPDAPAPALPAPKADVQSDASLCVEACTTERPTEGGSR